MCWLSLLCIFAERDEGWLIKKEETSGRSPERQGWKYSFVWSMAKDFTLNITLCKLWLTCDKWIVKTYLIFIIYCCLIKQKKKKKKLCMSPNMFKSCKTCAASSPSLLCIAPYNVFHTPSSLSLNQKKCSFSVAHLNHHQSRFLYNSQLLT